MQVEAAVPQLCGSAEAARQWVRAITAKSLSTCRHTGRETSSQFRWSGCYFQLNLPYPEIGMLGSEGHFACSFPCANPDCSGAANQCKWVIADQRCRAREFEADGITGERADGVELVCNTENDAGSVGSIGNEGRV